MTVDLDQRVANGSGSVAELIQKAIDKLRNECFDPAVYSKQIERWYLDQSPPKPTESRDDPIESHSDPPHPPSSSSPQNEVDSNDLSKDSNRSKSEEIEKQIESECTESTASKVGAESTLSPEPKSKSKLEPESNSKSKLKSFVLKSKSNRFQGVDSHTKCGLILFSAMIDSLDLFSRIDSLPSDKVLVRYIGRLHAIFGSLSHHDLRSGLQSISTSTSPPFGVMEHIRSLMIRCIESLHRRTADGDGIVIGIGTEHQVVWQQIYEILIWLSIGSTTVSALLKCTKLLLSLKYKWNSNEIGFEASTNRKLEEWVFPNCRRTMQYVANLRAHSFGAHRFEQFVDSKVFGFGKAGDGRLGLGSGYSSVSTVTSPQNIVHLNGAAIYRLSVFCQHSMALTTSGTVYFWGSLKNLDFGINSLSTSSVIQSAVQSEPVLLPLTLRERMVSICCGMAHSVMVTVSGTVFTFGHGASGRLGHGDDSNRSVPTKIESLSSVFMLSAHCGSTFTFLLSDDGDVYSFGKNQVGQCGLGSTDSVGVMTPTVIPTLSRSALNESGSASTDSSAESVVVVDIAGGWDHAVCCDSAGKCYSWGHGYEGGRAALGHGDKAMKTTPTPIEGLAAERVVTVCCGYDHSVVATASGDIWSWGYNANGQLGCGSRTEQMVPIKVDLPSKPPNAKIHQIAAGESHSICIDDSGLCWAWGHGDQYQNGNADGHILTVPTLIPMDKFKTKTGSDTGTVTKTHSAKGDTDRVAVRHIAAGKDFSLALTAKMESASASASRSKSKSKKKQKTKRDDVEGPDAVDDESESESLHSLNPWSVSLAKDKLTAIQVIVELLSVIDRSSKPLVPTHSEFWRSAGGLSKRNGALSSGKANNSASEPFAFEISQETFVLLGDLLIFCVSRIGRKSEGDDDGGQCPKWIWWLCAAILRILKAHFAVLANAKSQDSIDDHVLQQIHSQILSILDGDLSSTARNGRARRWVLEIRKESAEVLICGLHVFHKKPTERLSLLKSILTEPDREQQGNDDASTSTAILPFGRSLKEGLLQVFAQQIASQQITKFSSDELDDWLVILDSVHQTICDRLEQTADRILTINRIKRRHSKIVRAHSNDVDDGADNQKTVAMPVRCKCGGPMLCVKISKCYNGGGVCCDFCGQSCREDVWHCPKEKNAAEHSNGFDLCTLCVPRPMIPVQWIDGDLADLVVAEPADGSNVKADAVGTTKGNTLEVDNDDGDDEDEDDNDEDDDVEMSAARHPLIAAFQSTLSSSLTSERTEYLQAMRSYTAILFKHSEAALSKVLSRKKAILAEISGDDQLTAAQKWYFTKIVYKEIERIITVSLFGTGGVWWWLHWLHLLALYPFVVEEVFTSSMSMISILHQIRSHDAVETEMKSNINRHSFPFESICNLLTSLCSQLVVHQWTQWDIYKVDEAQNDNKSNAVEAVDSQSEQKSDETPKMTFIRNGVGLAKAMDKFLKLLQCDLSMKSLLILLDNGKAGNRTTVSSLFHSTHRLQVFSIFSKILRF